MAEDGQRGLHMQKLHMKNKPVKSLNNFNKIDLMKSSSKPLLLGSLAVLSWSTVATAFKVALNHMSVFEMVFVAVLTALVIFTIWMFVSNGWRQLRNLTPKLWGAFALLGLISPVAYYLVLFLAYDYLPAQIAQPVNYTWPILLTIMLAFIHRTPIPLMKYVGMIISFAGVVAISVGGKNLPGGVSVLGIGIAILSAFLWALYWIVSDRLKDSINQVGTLFLTFGFGMIYLLIGSCFIPLSHLSTEALLSGAYIGAFEMGIPFICFGMAIRTTDNPTLINQICYLSPFLSLFFISMILGEPIMPTTYLGLILIVAGLIFNQYIADRLTSRKAAV